MTDALILMIEDNTFDIELTLDAFHEAGLRNRVEVVRTGEAAMDYLYGDPAQCPLPDLVLLDLKLPGMSGHEVLAEMKSQQGFRRIPVVILTSSREEADLELSYDYGANSYLVKPVSFGEFLDVVRVIGKYWLTLNVQPPALEQTCRGEGV